MEPEFYETVQVRLFARFREALGGDRVELSLPGPVQVRAIRGALRDRFPTLRGLIDQSALAIDGEYAGDDEVIPVGSEVALIPPVSGG